MYIYLYIYIYICFLLLFSLSLYMYLYITETPRAGALASRGYRNPGTELIKIDSVLWFYHYEWIP